MPPSAKFQFAARRTLRRFPPTSRPRRLLPCGTCPRRSTARRPAHGQNIHRTGARDFSGVRSGPARSQCPCARCSARGSARAWGGFRCRPADPARPASRPAACSCRPARRRDRARACRAAHPKAPPGPSRSAPAGNSSPPRAAERGRGAPRRRNKIRLCTRGPASGRAPAARAAHLYADCAADRRSAAGRRTRRTRRTPRRAAFSSAAQILPAARPTPPI